MRNSEHTKRMLFLSGYKIGIDKKILNEQVNILHESKKTEAEASNILKRGLGIDDVASQQIITAYKQFDLSQNQVLLPFFASLYITKQKSNIGDRDYHTLLRDTSELVKDGRIKQPEVATDGFRVGDMVFNNYLKFAEYIHGLQNMSIGHAEATDIVVETDEKPIFDQNGIKIYDGNDIGKCINYTTGGLTGKHYGFCIGQPANTMWQSYRDSKVSTFYFLTDSNRKMNDPLHIVVIDNTQHGYELTDANNQTGNIAEYGGDVDAYFEYLEGLGVPTDNLFPNKPKTPEEEAETKKLGNSNGDISWFKSLTYAEQSKYIGRGHMLSDDQFNYIWQFKNNKGGFRLLHQYVDTGQPIPETQFNILVGKR